MRRTFLMCLLLAGCSDTSSTARDTSASSQNNKPLSEQRMYSISRHVPGIVRDSITGHITVPYQIKQVFGEKNKAGYAVMDTSDHLVIIKIVKTIDGKDEFEGVGSIFMEEGEGTYKCERNFTPSTQASDPSCSIEIMGAVQMSEVKVTSGNPTSSK